jgi:hypothetical protein
MLGSRVFRRVLPFGVPLRRTAFETKSTPLGRHQDRMTVVLSVIAWLHQV